MKGWRNALVSCATVASILLFSVASVSAGIFTPVGVIDQTPLSPVADPAPASYQPRYVSGFGLDDSFTIFFEDRDSASVISYVSTTTGPTGFPASATATNIADTHFLVKDWPDPRGRRRLHLPWLGGGGEQPGSPFLRVQRSDQLDAGLHIHHPECGRLHRCSGSRLSTVSTM